MPQFLGDVNIPCPINVILLQVHPGQNRGQICWHLCGKLGKAIHFLLDE